MTRKLSFTYPSVEHLRYSEQDPFPHAVFSDCWDRSLLLDCEQEINHHVDWDGTKEFYGSRRKRFCRRIDALPSAVRCVIREASSPAFLSWLESVTGEEGLLPDPDLLGGGIHSIMKGGFLKIHSDFNWHADLKEYRRLNLLLYLNSDWHEDWGGQLELWDSKVQVCKKRIPPRQNNMVIFTTDERSFHGHPNPWQAPEGVYRNSLALYYYSSTRPAGAVYFKRTSTDYRPIMGDNFTHVSRLTLFLSELSVVKYLKAVVDRLSFLWRKT